MKKAELNNILYSMPFLFLFMNRLLSSYNQIYFSEASKLIGLHLLKDDALVTYILLFGVFVNITFRTFLGSIFNNLKIKKMVHLCWIINFLTSISIFIFGTGTFGFFVMIQIQRVSSGKIFIV